MATDDDLLVVIVGDENEDVDTVHQDVFIKEEIMDEDYKITELIEMVEKHGQRIDLDFETTIKQEAIDDNDGMDKDYIDEDCNDEDYEVDDDDDDDDDDNFDSDDNVKMQRKRGRRDGTTSSDGRRHTMLKAWQRKSYVAELKKRSPKLRTNPDQLINKLANIMKNLKPPPPPKDYFIMNECKFECVKCGSLSQTIPEASRHYQHKHGPRYLVCYACGVDFRSTTNLFKHEKRCSAPDIVVVLRARAQFVGNKGRSRPFLCHTPKDKKKKKKVPGEKPFNCEQCSAKFCSNPTLQAHINMHKGVRPYKCSGCIAAYTSRTGLLRHYSKAHSNIEFICDYCNRSFKVKAALVTHLDTHAPEKKFPCELCDKRYAQKAALVLHVNREHRHLPPPCACQICPKRYPRMSILKAHMMREHGMALMTRKMFFKALPTMSQKEIEQAKVVLKTDIPTLAVDKEKSAPEFIEQYIVPHTFGNDSSRDVSDPEEQEANETEQSKDVFSKYPFLTDKLLQYIQKVREDNAGESMTVMRIENGEIVEVQEGDIMFQIEKADVEVDDVK